MVAFFDDDDDDDDGWAKQAGRVCDSSPGVRSFPDICLEAGT